MTVLEIVQEAAKRLCIIVPKTILLADVGSKEYDADTGLLVSCLNGCIKQMMALNLFNQNIEFFFRTGADIQASGYLEVIDGSDFSLVLSRMCPDFEELLGDGITFTKDGKYYLFRQLTSQDFVRLCKKENYGFKPDTYVPDRKKEIENYKKNMPSEDKTYITYASNLESGFYIHDIQPKRRIIYFCNNLCNMSDYSQINVYWSVSFLYRSNYGVISADGSQRQPSVLTEKSTGEIDPEVKTNDYQTTVLPDELAILGTIIKYKAYYGMDFSMDLGEQKAMVDALKENQENVQITHLNKKAYR